MQSNKKTIFPAFLLTAVFLLSGCSPDQQARFFPQPDFAEMPQSDPVAKRFQESAPQGQTAVESAIALSQKYAKLSEEAAALRRQNQDLVAKNQQLNDQAIAMEAQLQQTQKELAEANDLLIEMRVELNNWKTDILGFRDEMRDAETAQLEALLRILKVLGGEIETESAKGQDAGSTVASLGEPRQP